MFNDSDISLIIHDNTLIIIIRVKILVLLEPKCNSVCACVRACVGDLSAKDFEQISDCRVKVRPRAVGEWTLTCTELVEETESGTHTHTHTQSSSFC